MGEYSSIVQRCCPRQEMQEVQDIHLRGQQDATRLGGLAFACINSEFQPVSGVIANQRIYTESLSLHLFFPVMSFKSLLSVQNRP